MYFLIVNGGAKPSGCYGSYIILRGRTLSPNVHRYSPLVETAHKTFDLPETEASTTDEAEYRALIRGLIGLMGRPKLEVKILSRSELVIKQICGEYEVRAENLCELNHRVVNLLENFDYSLIWVDRDIIEEYLGHNPPQQEGQEGRDQS